MDTIIYTASPLKAFSGYFIMIAFFFGLSLVSIVSAFIDRRNRNKMFSRIALGCSSIILILAGIGSAIVTYRSYVSGDKTVLVRVEEKNEVKRNCGSDSSSRRICIDYVAETTDGKKYYVFNLGEDLWNEVEVMSCYKFTYYPSKSLLGDYLQEDNAYTELYEPTGAITQIMHVTCP